RTTRRSSPAGTEFRRATGPAPKTWRPTEQSRGPPNTLWNSRGVEPGEPSAAEAEPGEPS
ncbi:hypothetical protein GOODEAATRI_033451, partial [Goodea atripinnis]